MHRILLRLQKMTLAAMFAGLLAFGSVQAVVQTVQHNDAVEQQEVSQQEAQFWRAVAGQGSDNLPVVASALARDLREVIEDEQAVDEFYGTSNRYGGVSAAIGFDPFDETGLRCDECGPLDAQTKINLDLIRSGSLDQVIGTTEVAAPEDGMTLTPFGWSVGTTVGIVWLLGGPLALAVGHQMAMGGYPEYSIRRFGDLKWERNGKNEVEKLSIIALAPTFMVPYLLFKRANRKHFQEKVRNAFPEHTALVEQTDRFLDHYGNGPSATILREHRDQVCAELESQTRAGEVHDNNPELDVLLEELNQTMEYLRLRVQAKHELGEHG